MSIPRTPGAYIYELDAFGNSVVPIGTAVPAFIGYTPQAQYEGKSYTNVPFKISSFQEFLTVFCHPNPAPPAPPVKQYAPDYYLVEQKEKPNGGSYLQLNGTFYSVLPDPNTLYYLYNSVRLYFENGGGTAYIVSVGSYGPPSGKPVDSFAHPINPNVTLDDLSNGLKVLKGEPEPTMYICPEATLLSIPNNGTLMEEMLLQCDEMQTAMAIFDVIGSKYPDPILFMDDIETFRERTGSNGLKFGAAYYPFIGTTIMQTSDMDYMNLFGGDVSQLSGVLSNASDETKTILNEIISGTSTRTTAQMNQALLEASPEYSEIMKYVLHDANLLPPSGGMAGVIAKTDDQYGPWNAPANTSIVGVSSLPIELSSAQQENLNIDAVSGKSVNAIRSFSGQGILVWGARTLDGNSMDWRYINVRRTATFIEQSCKLAARAYVFAPNDSNTWSLVVSMISSFLTDVWKQGGLQGTTPGAAFMVNCGLGSTMTGEDLLKGIMRVDIKVALVHPAEFIIITFEQEMQKS